MKNRVKSTCILAVTYTLLLFNCSTTKPKEVKLVNLPDSVLVHFSYSLFPEGGFHGYIKQTSMYNSTLPIREIGGSFTEKGSKEVLVAVPYISVHGSFSKLFLVQNNGASPELIDWFHDDCTRYSILDIDNDGLNEVITEYDQNDQDNVKQDTYQIYSLAHNKSRILFQSISQDAQESFNLENRIPGDTIVSWSNHVLLDTNKDSIYELTEIRQFVRIEETLSLGKFRTKEMVDTIVMTLKSDPIPSLQE